jgi:O-antigen/teichoic acid export membrane protein
MPKRLLKDSFLYGVADFISKGIASLLFPLFTKYLSVIDFGVLALITVVSSLVSMFAECGINNAVQLFYFEKRFESNKKVLVTTGLLLQVFIGVLCVVVFVTILYPLEFVLLNRYQIKWDWLILSILIVIPNLVIRYSLNITRLHYKPLIFGALSLFTNLLWMFLAIHLMKNEGMGIDGYLIANLILLLMIFPFSILAIKRDIGVKVDTGLAVEMFKLGFPFIFSNIAFWLFGSLDRWLLAEYSDTIQVGLYSIAYKIALVVVMVNAAFSQAWSPLLLKVLNNDIQESIRYLHRVSKYYLSFLSVICVGITLFSKEVLVLMTPETYWPASISIGLIAFAIFINGTMHFTLVGISFKKETRLINYASWMAVFINISVNIFLSKWFGATGASLAMVITFFFLSFFYNYFSRRVFNFSLKSSSFLLPGIMIIISNVYVILTDNINFNWINIFFKIGLISLLMIYNIKNLKIKIGDILNPTNL